MPDGDPASASISAITAAVAAWIGACVSAIWVALILPFKLIFGTINSIFSGVPISAYLRLLLLTSSDVISLEYNNTDVADYEHLLCVYLPSMCPV